MYRVLFAFASSFKHRRGQHPHQFYSDKTRFAGLSSTACLPLFRRCTLLFGTFRSCWLPTIVPYVPKNRAP
jgi:hypothetical protein